MAFPGTGKIWMNGTLVDWRDAKIHIASHVIHYGSAVFEGARCYATPKGSACFRLDAHMRRLLDSEKIYRMEYPLDLSGWQNAVLETIRANELKACYIRPLVYRGYSHVGVNPVGTPIEVMVAAYPWGKYLGDEALTKGVAVKIGTWARMAPNTLPAMAKAGGNYLNSQLLKLEAVEDGYAEAIALDTNGYVSEGSGENLFLVLKGELVTTPLHNSILAGITRASVLQLARELGYNVREMVVPRELLYVADEVFFTGTAVEVTPITSVDRIIVGAGEVGPVTKAIQQAFFGIVHGDVPDRHGWLTKVTRAASPARA